MKERSEKDYLLHEYNVYMRLAKHAFDHSLNHSDIVYRINMQKRSQALYKIAYSIRDIIDDL